MNPKLRTGMYQITVVALAIGCSSAKSPEAQATPEPAAPIQVAQADAAAAPAATGGSATITGSVTLVGAAPVQDKIKMDADPQCALQHNEPVYKEEVVANPNGTLRNAFVYVKQGLEGKTFATPTTPAQFNQRGCRYEPHVLGVQVNQPMEILNSDATLHNVNCKPTKSKPFNIAQPVKGMKSSKTFTAPEVMVKCACNVHPWMNAYMGVLPHPFFSVTRDDGRFTLAGLPAGTYTVEAWQEKLGTQTQTVTVADGESKSVDFEFKAQ